MKDKSLRIYFTGLFLLLGLTSCANYMGMHTTAQPYHAADLAIHHRYPIPSKQAASLAWSQRFHDPQLNQLIAIALADSPDMQVARNRVTRACYLANEIGASRWPSVDFSGYLQRQRFSQFGLAPPPFNGRTFNIGELGLNFNYEFDFWGKNREMFASSVNETYAAKADQAEAHLIIATAVADTYFQLQAEETERGIAFDLLHQRQAILSIIQYRAAHGVESDIPVTTVMADMQTARLAVAQHTQAAALLRHQLAVLIGKNPFTTEIKILPFTYHYYALPPVIPANLLAQRPDISASRFRVEAAAHRINVAKARFFPDINLIGLYSYQSVLLGRLFERASQNNAITGAIDLPIFDAGARRADLGVNNADYDVAVNQYNQTILTALREVADQLSILHAVNAQVLAQTNAVKAMRRNYKLTNSRYNHGIADYLSVLQIKGQLLQQQATQVDYQIRHLHAIVALIKALGGDYQAMEGSYGDNRLSSQIHSSF